MELHEDIENLIIDYVYQIQHVERMIPIFEFIKKFDYKSTKRDLRFIYKCCYQKYHGLYIYLPTPMYKLKFNE